MEKISAHILILVCRSCKTLTLAETEHNVNGSRCIAPYMRVYNYLNF